MRVPSLTLALTFCLVAGQASAQSPSTNTLPLKRVRLYETGVGYFERTGRVDGRRGSVALPVPAGHLDDALKTVVVLSAGGDAEVQGIEFRSSASRPLALALAGLPDDSQGPMSHEQLLGSLRGAAVELRTARGSHAGRLIEVIGPDEDRAEQCRKLTEVASSGSPAQPPEARDRWLAACAESGSLTLLLLTSRGDIRRFAAVEIESVRPVDPAFRARLGAALDTLGQRGPQTHRQLRLHATPGKPVSLGYVAEAPIWRSTYRLILDGSSPQAALQGWALLHNDTDEDWRDVQVELCNGQPDSFLFPLAAPRYARRELVTPDWELSTVPQLLDRTVDNMWVGESYGMGGLGLSGVGSGGGGRGSGMGMGRLATVGAGHRASHSASGLLAVGNLAAVQNAEGTEAGALFRYALPTPVDLGAHGSALLPFVSRPVRAGRIAVFAKPGGAARSAVHLVNDTGQTLPPGTVALFADGGFAGESALSRTKPSESRIVSFGIDLDVELNQQSARYADEPRLLVADDNALIEHFVRRHEISHQLVNRTTAPRTVYLRLSFVRNSEIDGVETTAFDSERNTAYAVFKLAPKTRRNRTVKVTEGLQRRHEVAKLTIKELERFARQDALPAAQRKTLVGTAKLLREAVRQGRKRRHADEQRQQLDRDVQRLREDIRALGPGSAGAAEFVKRLLAAETRARLLRKKSQGAKNAATRARAKAHQQLRGLSALRS